MGNARRRPAPVPSIATETTISGPGVATPTDPAAARAIQSLQRTIDVLEGPAKTAASHPTLRDQVIATTLTTGDNRIAHGLGRAPRFVYVTLLALPAGWVSWRWAQQNGDLDRDRIDVVLANDGALGSVSLDAIVRIE